ncbi:RluA family pseudouridine synthase [Sunxiuqinia elliptica]|uniref:tRNA pseudouridine synthase C n=1 Tax=Sunxiuqinia elliptica TaxID=655355 RepID=A0A4R6GVJ0_9BACT|nr:pseudouridine synthase [Sunxiuqinia elliptica]TDN98910.1 tRNA pseudouridine synthase C [Sunxiuqinia elliptica]TDO56351.1 tRNA pseudouridine synthase C [Sunxiuqinia elliptica]
MDIPVIFQDEYLVVVDKPVDLPVHKNDFMPHDAPYLTKLIGDQYGKWIYNVHRLDSKTSGLIVLAFSSEVAHELTLQFERKEILKEYAAIVVGELPEKGVFDEKVLVKKKSKFKKPAVTHFEREKLVPTSISYKEQDEVFLSLARVMPETGRWHQIRQHFAKNRHDIVGDSHHGDFTLNKLIRAEWGFNRLMLHARKLGFKHPETEEDLLFETNLPAEFEALLQAVAPK